MLCQESNSAVYFFSSLAPDLPQDSQSSVGSPLSRVGTQIIGAEDDDFDTEQEQVGMTVHRPLKPMSLCAFRCIYEELSKQSCLVFLAVACLKNSVSMYLYRLTGSAAASRTSSS